MFCLFGLASSAFRSLRFQSLTVNYQRFAEQAHRLQALKETSGNLTALQLPLVPSVESGLIHKHFQLKPTLKISMISGKSETSSPGNGE